MHLPLSKLPVSTVSQDTGEGNQFSREGTHLMEWVAKAEYTQSSILCCIDISSN